MDELAARINHLSEEKRQLLDRRLRRVAARVLAPGIPRRPVGTTPLSAAQARLWFLQQLDPESTAYNETSAVRLRGDLDVEALERAVVELVRRHAVFRARFSITDDGLRQRIVATRDALPDPVVDDLKDLPEDERERVIRKILREEAARPFDLARGPLLRTRLLRLGPQEHVAVLAMHHVAADGWSIELFLRELVTAYAATRDHARPPLLPPAAEYADYAAWQNEWLESEDCRHQLSWWRETLEGAPRLLELPLDHPRPSQPTGRGFEIPVVVAAETAERLRTVASEENATLFMALLAAFDLFLSRLSGTTDIVVGTPVAGRTHPDLDEIVGFFVNTIVLRVDVGGTLSFRDALRRARDASVNAYAHMEVPFERVVEELRPPRLLGVTPVFQAMLVLQNFPYAREPLPGLVVEPVAVEPETAKFDLTLIGRERGSRLELVLELSSDLFERPAGERFAVALGGLLEALAAEPDRLPEDDLCVTTADARAVEAPGSVIELVADAAERTPDACACAGAGGPRTYGELAQDTAAVACALVKAGVGPGDVVGLYADSSTALPVAVLGILRARATWLPLEPADPLERTAWMLRDAGAAAVVSERRLASRLVDAGFRALLLDELHEVGTPPAMPAGTAGASLVYTSGSTGTPNAVLTSHRALAVHAVGIVDRYALRGGDRVLQLASPAFDVAEEEIFPTLAAGATVVMPAIRGAVGLASLTDVVTDLHVSVVNLPSSAWEVWLEELERSPDGFPGSLRLVVTGSEPALVADLERWQRLVPQGVTLLHAYGATECTITSTVHETVEGTELGTTIPVGRPLPGTMVHVLDETLRPLPVGAWGEVVVAGEGLAVGYRGRPALTRQRFVQTDLAGTRTRVFRTGDVGRLRADGVLELKGRRDDQLKVRGVRVEPGEVERALRRDQAVRTAIVAPVGTGAARRLIAYVVPRGAPPTADALRAGLRQSLPTGLIPSEFVFLESLPRTVGGKVDRGALVSPPAKRRASVRRTQSAQADTLASIAAELLGVEEVGADDDLFELGAHSLLLIRFAARIRTTLGVELPLRTFFETPTAAGLAEAVLDAIHTADAGPVETPAVEPLPQGHPAPASFAQQQLLALGPQVASSGLFAIGFGVSVRGTIDIDVLRASLVELLRRHVALRTSFIADGNAFLQVPFEVEHAPLEEMDLSRHAESIRDGRLAAAAQAFVRGPFEPGLPLLRALLIRLANRESALVMSVHHLAADGTSVELLGSELVALYDAFATGRSTPLAEPPLQYRDVAAWERNALTAAVVERDLAHWRDVLASRPPPLIQRPDPAAPSYIYHRHELELTNDLVASIRRVARRTGASTFITLLAAFGVVLGRRAGRERLLAGTLIDTRPAPELHAVVGLFVNTVALRLEANADASFAEIVHRTRTELLEAIAHARTPFERVAAEVGGDEPLFDVLCMYDRRSLPAEPAGGLTVEPLSIGPQPGDLEILPSDFALVLEFVEGRDGITATVRTCADRFASEAGAGLLVELSAFLESAAAAPDTRVAELLRPADDIPERSEAT